jgi:hypothetical protein
MVGNIVIEIVVSKVNIDLTQQQVAMFRGEKGDKPIKGVDYFTEEDKQQFVEEIAGVHIPTKTSELENDSNFIGDNNYVHTDNNFSNELKSSYDDAVSKKHSHTNKDLLDSYKQTEENLANVVANVHSHINKNLLDTYRQSETDIADAVGKKHAHINQETLNNTTASYTAEEKTKLANIESNANNYVLPNDVVKDENYIHTDNNFTLTLKDKVENIEENAQVNVLETIKLNNNTLSVENKSVTIELDTYLAGLFKSVSYNGTNGVLTFTKYDNTTATVDLPLELIVNSGYYDNVNKNLVLVLANLSEILIPVGDLLVGIATESYVDNSISTLQNSINTALNLKVDKVYKTGSETEYKVLSDNNLTDAEKTKLANTSGINTGDQDLSGKVDKVVGKSLIADTEISRLSTLNNYDDTNIKNDISNLQTNKVDKVDGKSLVNDIEIIRLSTVANYDDTTVKSDISNLQNNKVDKITGKSLIADTEISRLLTLSNYDDTLIKQEKLDKKPDGINDLITDNKLSSTYKPVYTKTEIGLENVDNTSDLDKPISTVTQNALDEKMDNPIDGQFEQDNFRIICRGTYNTINRAEPIRDMTGGHFGDDEIVGYNTIEETFYKLRKKTTAINNEDAIAYFNDGKLGSEVTPTATTDYTNKAYVDGLVSTIQTTLVGKEPITNYENLIASSWTDLANSAPYTKQSTLTAVNTIGENTIVELLNNQTVLFATYGFVIGAVEGQNIIIYSIDNPVDNVTFKIGIRG